MHASRRSMLAATALVLTGLAQAADPTELNFGIIATEKAGALKQMWEPFLEDMSKAVGLKVNGSSPPTTPASSKAALQQGPDRLVWQQVGDRCR
jgi:ABC-type phosphate/phosphonate transport system substrate-binding protein